MRRLSRHNLNSVQVTMRPLVALLAAACLLCFAPSRASAEVIYVDFGHSVATDYTVGLNTVNVRNGAGTTSDLETITNAPTAIDITLAFVGGSSGSSDSTNGLMPNSGTDGYNLFNGYINAVGLSALNGGTIRLTLAGLDSNTLYDVAILSNRIDDALDTEDETYTLSDVSSGFANISSAGTTISTVALTDDRTAFDSRANTGDGYLARWNSINPGVDGDFTIDITAVAPHVVYATGLRLEFASNAVPEPSTYALALLGLAVLGLAAATRRRGAGRKE